MCPVSLAELPILLSSRCEIMYTLSQHVYLLWNKNYRSIYFPKKIWNIQTINTYKPDTPHNSCQCFCHTSEIMYTQLNRIHSLRHKNSLKKTLQYTGNQHINTYKTTHTTCRPVIKVKHLSARLEKNASLVPIMQRPQKSMQQTQESMQLYMAVTGLPLIY